MFQRLIQQQELTLIYARLKKLEDKIASLEKQLKSLQKQNSK